MDSVSYKVFQGNVVDRTSHTLNYVYSPFNRSEENVETPSVIDK